MKPRAWHRALIFLVKASSGHSVCRGVRKDIYECETPLEALGKVGDRYVERLNALLEFTQQKLGGKGPGYALQVLIRTSQPRWDYRPRCLTSFARSVGWKS